jgi:peptidoglycan hydrolase-like protein with peptidoglycan-binding domain
VTRNPQPWLDAHPGPAQRRVLASKMQAGQQDSDSVRWLQEALNEHGATLPVTGNYGPQTVAACAEFQRSQGWAGPDADGIAGPETARRLGLTWVQD